MLEDHAIFCTGGSGVGEVIMKTIEDVLANNEYPGRGLIVGKSADNKNAVACYWIMGRSKGSRNRIFVSEGTGSSQVIKTVPFDRAIVEGDPSLIIYNAMRIVDDTLILTNGDQTDTIADALQKGGSFVDALATRKYEHDAPNYTPRISSITKVDGGGMTCSLSIIKRATSSAKKLSPDAAGVTHDGAMVAECVASDVVCSTFSYDDTAPGVGHLITTYKHNGNPLPSFDGPPIDVALPALLDELAASLWASLNNDNKVALLVRFTDLSTKVATTKIINKLQ